MSSPCNLFTTEEFVYILSEDFEVPKYIRCLKIISTSANLVYLQWDDEPKQYLRRKKENAVVSSKSFYTYLTSKLDLPCNFERIVLFLEKKGILRVEVRMFPSKVI